MYKTLKISVACTLFSMNLTASIHQDIALVSPSYTTTLFSHGLAGTYRQVYRYADWYKNREGQRIYNQRYTISHPLVTFNFHDSWRWEFPNERYIPLRKAVFHLIKGNYTQTSFAQENEIERLHEVYRTKINTVDNVIFYGVSRGASIYMPFSALYNPSNVVAAVLESPFDSMDSIVRSKINQFRAHNYISESQGHSILENVFRKYKRTGTPPIGYVDQVPHSVPLLIVCAKTDTLVPYESSFNLYNALRQSGHENAHILILEKGRHGFLLEGDDGDKYERVVHAFYKHYNLPHDAQLAESGAADFMLCRP